MIRAVAVMGVAGMVACLPTEDDQVQQSEGFETCGLCGWSVVGTASVVVTNHPGEHAAQLERDAVLRRELGIRRTVTGAATSSYDGNFTDGNWIEYSTDCPGRPELTLPVISRGVVEVRLALTGPADGGFRRRHLTFPPLPPGAVDLDPPDDPYTGPGDIEITFRALELVSRGRCRIDNLRVMISGGTVGY